MKINIELKDEKFIWEYSMGIHSTTGEPTERHHGEHPISSQGLAIFCNVMNMCHNSYVNENEEWMEKIKAVAFLEKHYPEVTKKLKEEGKLKV